MGPIFQDRLRLRLRVRLRHDGGKYAEEDPT
jgi:hypothetical protein